MSKKANTVLFIIGATVFNIAVTVLCFVVLFLIFLRLLFPHLPQASLNWMIPVNFTASIAASWFIYRRIIGIILKKVDLEKYLDPVPKIPLFTRRGS